MNFNFIGRVCRIAAIGAILLGSASCIHINEELGENLIPTEHLWDVFSPEAVDLTDIRLQMADSLSGYNTTRFTFGSVRSESQGANTKSTSFTLIPVRDTMDFGKNTKIRQFHFSAVRDTLSVINDNELKMLQNVYVSELKQPLDSTVIYMGSFSQYTAKGLENRAKFLQPEQRITIGTPVYAGGDSLSFDFSLDFAKRFKDQIVAAQKAGQMDSVDHFLKYLPGIHITTDSPAGFGGRINMFNLELETNSYYQITGNYAELKFTAEYEHSEEPVDTSFLFFFGAGDFISISDEGSITYPTQFALNTSDHESSLVYGEDGIEATTTIIVEGGNGVKPVIKAEGIKQIVEDLVAQAGIKDPKEVVINKATIIMPYDVNGNYDLLDKYPTILSPTVRLHSSDGEYVTYAGLTDSSISSENQGDINRSTFRYSPDISHHVQEILKLDRNDADYSSTIENYDIWFLIMHEEVTETESDNSYSDYYNNLLYNSYYNNMMYDPYGYGGYGYGGYGYGYGYGYGGYGYGSNYYNYAMMSYYASMGSGSETTQSSVELDKDRYYDAVLKGPEAPDGPRPQIKVTFSAPKTAE